MKKDKIIILDGNAIMHRSFHAIPDLTSPRGEQVNAVYGFVLTLLRAIKDLSPTHIIACFDAGRVTFRNELYDGYKANRPKTDEGLIAQIPRIWQFLESLSIPTYQQKGVEADDLVGTIARDAERNNFEVFIVTGDKDALQLVNDNIRVYSLHRGVADTLIYNPTVVKEKMGVRPDQVVLYKSLSGDSSDNIPGVPGIGPKTAVELINRYDSIEKIYEHLEDLTPRQATLLKEGEEKMRMSRQLATIVDDLKIEIDYDRAKTSHFHFDHAVQFFNEVGFKSLINRLPESAKISQSSLFANSPEKKDALPYSYALTKEAVLEVLGKIAQAKMIAVDTETVDLGGELLGISIAWSENDAVYIPICPPSGVGVKLEDIKAELQAVLGNDEIRKIGHNIKYDLASLGRAGLQVRNIYFDTMLASSLSASQLQSNKLDDVAMSRLGYRKIAIKDMLGDKNFQEIGSVDIEKIASYACEDALVTMRLFGKIAPDIEAMHLKKIFYEIEMPLVEILYHMESYGVKFDVEYLSKLGRQVQSRLDELKTQATQIAGEEFNLSSPAQLKKILFDKLHLPTTGLKRTKTGISTDAESLSKLQGKHELIDLILENRELSKLNSTYIEALPQLVDGQGRLHTSFNQVGAVTGRLSSSNPNLQNIPIKSELGQKVRQAFVASEGMALLSADFSQAELRVVAHLSGDEKLIEAFENGEDIHKAVADQLGVDRRMAKAINFGIIYGIGPNALANDLGIGISEARDFIAKYFEKYPKMRQFIDDKIRQAREQGYVETLFGRRRYLGDIDSPNPMLRAAAERMAINMPAQGTVADIMKLSMIKVAERPIEGATMILQIHDELLFEVRHDRLEACAKQVQQIMSSIAQLRVPMIVGLKSGDNWAQMKPLEK